MASKKPISLYRVSDDDDNDNNSYYNNNNNNNNNNNLKVYFEGAIFGEPPEKQWKHVFTIVANVQLCWKCAVLQMFFKELAPNLQNSYFIELFPLYAKQKPVEYSPSGVL